LKRPFLVEGETACCVLRVERTWRTFYHTFHKYRGFPIKEMRESSTTQTPSFRQENKVNHKQSYKQMALKFESNVV